MARWRWQWSAQRAAMASDSVRQLSRAVSSAQASLMHVLTKVDVVLLKEVEGDDPGGVRDDLIHPPGGSGQAARARARV